MERPNQPLMDIPARPSTLPRSNELRPTQDRMINHFTFLDNVIYGRACEICGPQLYDAIQ